MICHFPVRLLEVSRLILALVCFAGVVAPARAQFETRATSAIVGEGLSVAVGDFNRDGKLDIAAVAGNYLSVLLGNGDGTFQAPVNYPGVFYSVVVADFNNDGNLDLVVLPDSETVSVFLGNGDGTFQPPKSSSIASPASFVAVGNFNGDHNMDIVVIDNPYISVLLGNGDGTFQPPIDNSSSVGVHQLVVGDFSNDHRLDVAGVGYFGGSQNLWMLLGNGDGTLQPALKYPLVNTPGSVATADFNHDGNLDLVVGTYLGNGVTVLLGKGDGSFRPGVIYATTGEGGNVGVQDFNGDGIPDIVATDGVPIGLDEFLGSGDGTFRSPQFVSAPAPGGPIVGDFNGDHLQDVLLLGGNPQGVITMLNTGVVGFTPTTPVVFPTQLIHTSSVPVVATLNNTGGNSLSISSIRVSGPFHLGNGTTCEDSVGGGASCMIDVIFQPKSEGTFSGLITIVDSSSSKPQVIELSGVGTVVKVSPVSLSFGDQKVGSKSAAQTVTATNKGGTSITYSSVTIQGADKNDFSEVDSCTGRSIPPGGSCEARVTFAPNKTGKRSGLLYFNFSAGSTVSPQPVTLSGTGD
jgi:hypothetical protein